MLDSEPSAGGDEEGTVDGLPTPDPGVAAVVSAGVALAPLAAYGPIGAAFTAVLTPALATMIQRAVNELAQIRAGRGAKVLADAADRGGVSIEELFHRIGDDPVRLTLLSDAMQAASRTNIDSKIRVLGAALAAGALATDDALIDEQILLVAAIADLEAPHIQVLKIITDGTQRTGYMGTERRGVSEREIVQLRKGLEGFGGTSLLQPILRVLDRNGLIYQTGIGEIWDENMADDVRPGAGSNEWAATRFAQSLISMLLDSGQSCGECRNGAVEHALWGAT
jgi:hypothetical protein